MTLLKLEELSTHYRTEEGPVHAADDVSFELGEHESLGLVGESGSGKTTVARSIMRILPDNGEIVDGSITYKGTELTGMPEPEFRKQIRWKEIAIIPQNAMNGFDPVYTVGTQIVQAIRTHEKDISKQKAWERTYELFNRVGLEESRAHDYPHQFSGGMAQRAMIALALSVDPSLILADEPTTALDVIIQDRILQTIQDLQDEYESSMILITHDMSVVSETCDKIAVFYAGRIVEYADAKTVIKHPRHPYTLGLRNAFPSITEESQELVSIPGDPPGLIQPAEGCRFAPRCPFAQEECWDITPPPTRYGDGHVVECHRADEIEYLREEARKASTWRKAQEEQPVV